MSERALTNVSRNKRDGHHHITAWMHVCFVQSGSRSTAR